MILSNFSKLTTKNNNNITVDQFTYQPSINKFSWQYNKEDGHQHKVLYDTDTITVIAPMYYLIADKYDITFKQNNNTSYVIYNENLKIPVQIANYTFYIDQYSVSINCNSHNIFYYIYAPTKQTNILFTIENIIFCLPDFTIIVQQEQYSFKLYYNMDATIAYIICIDNKHTYYITHYFLYNRTTYDILWLNSDGNYNGLCLMPFQHVISSTIYYLKDNIIQQPITLIFINYANIRDTNLAQLATNIIMQYDQYTAYNISKQVIDKHIQWITNNTVYNIFTHAQDDKLIVILKYSNYPPRILIFYNTLSDKVDDIVRHIQNEFNLYYNIL